MNIEDKALLIETLGKRPPDTAIHQLEQACRTTGLDWKLRHLYLIERGGKWRVELSIDGFRAVAASDPEYNGQAGPFWTTGAAQPWTDVPPEKEPYAARVGVYRRGQTDPTWGIAKYSDYATGQMYRKFPSTMIAKCAEMMALRKAFPHRLGGLYGAEEMEQSERAAAKRSAAVEHPQPSHTPIPTLDFSSAIAAAKSLDELKHVGEEIRTSTLGLDTKMALSREFQARKAEMGW